MWRISGVPRAYDWGSTSALQSFVDLEPTGEPLAELWFGTHALGLSSASTDAGDIPLTDVAGELSFMLKILAPDQPLSIQVHPSRELAERGFADENASGTAPADPMRDYKDPYDKPEMVYALSSFETLLGLRPLQEIRDLLTPLQVSLAKHMLEYAADGRLSVLKYVLSSPPNPDEVGELVDACLGQLSADIGRGYATVVEAANVHPGDPGLALALLMNRVTLEPGEAAFIGPGLLHAHLSGLCLEVMASSDNVLRAGLTTKKVNRDGVLNSLDAVPPTSVHVSRFDDSTEVLSPGSNLFALSVTHGASDLLPGTGQRILLCIDGSIEIVDRRGASITLSRGQAAFADADDGELSTRGSGTTAQAFVSA
jgi:mannose-6-phosphate isomerase